MLSAPSRNKTQYGIPLIKELACITTRCNEDTHKVGEGPLPHTKLELMHEVRYEELVHVASKRRKAFRPRRLYNDRINNTVA